MRYIISLLTLIVFLVPHNILALTSNSNSTDLADASTHFWSITDAAQTGLEPGAAFTVAAWVYLDSDQGQNRLIAKWEDSPNQAYGLRFTATALAADFSSDGTAVNSYTAATTINTATWYHVAWTYAGASTRLRFFLNGAQVGSDTSTTETSIFNGTNPYRIGSNYPAVSSYDGKIDDMRIWTRELTTTEIDNLYDNPCTFDNGASLGAQWLFDNDGGVDQTANNNDLTANNSVADSSTSVAYTCPAVASPVDDTRVWVSDD